MTDKKMKQAAKTGLFLGVMALMGCATGSQNYVSNVSPEGKLFGNYLAGTYANYLNDAPARSKYFTAAFAQESDDISLARRAVVSALSAGDFSKAETLAGEVHASGLVEPMSEATLGAKALREGQYAKALEYFDLQTADLTVSIMMKIMAGWAQHGAGDDAAAREIFSNLPGGSYFTRFGLLQMAKLETKLGNYDAAKTALTALEAQGTDTFDLEVKLAAAQITALSGNPSGALAALKAYSEENGVFETGPVPSTIAKLEAGETLIANLSPQKNASRALVETAYGFFAANRSLEGAELFLRMGLSQDQQYDKGKLWLADILAAFKRDDEALVYYDGVPNQSPFYVSGQLAKGYLFLRREQNDKALAVFQSLNSAHPSVVTRDALGRVYLSEENYAEALPIYEALVASLTEEELKQDPTTLYLRGICYEREKQWDKAVADFQKVLSYKPDNADTLNYLGYTWVDRGENLTEAFRMIRRAVELEPDSGAIVDSLGWAHYKLGQYKEAKEQLELAVTLSPSSATIIDHLGDVYYKLGRKREAAFQWERALEYDPTEAEIKTIKQKLQGGLSAVQAAP